MRRAERPTQAYCDALYQHIREAVASMRHDGCRKMHRIGIAKRVVHKIDQMKKRNEWDYGIPTHLTIFRRLEEMAKEKDWVANIEKGSGWYRMRRDLLKQP